MGKLIGTMAVTVFVAGVLITPCTSEAQVIHGCFKKNNGQLRIVNSPNRCRPSERSISWNMVGPEGPQGLTGATGPQGPAGPKGDPGEAAPVLQLVGFTSTVFTGDMGILAYSRACASQYPQSRMCTSEEVMNTFNPPALPSTWAWSRPSFSPLSMGSENPTVVDMSGIDGDPLMLTCSGWKNSASTGLATDDTGAFDLQGCSSSIPVACCSAEQGGDGSGGAAVQ